MSSKVRNISKKQRFRIFERDEFTCQYCGRRPDQDSVTLQVDHSISVKDGGTDDDINLVTSCYDCNIGKGPKSVLKRTKTEQDVQEELDKAQERLEQVKRMNEKKREIEEVHDDIFLQRAQWIRDILGDSFKDEVVKRVQKYADKEKLDTDVLSEALEITRNKHQKHGFSGIDSFMYYLQGVYRNLSLTEEQQEILGLYFKEVFVYDRMNKSTRQMILDYSEYGYPFHREVVNTIHRMQSEKRWETYKVREAAQRYVPQTTFRVTKSGKNLQALVCDTILLVIEE